MYRIILVLFAIIASFTACSKERKAKEMKHLEMEAHGMPSDWKSTVSQGSPIEGRKLFIEMEIPTQGSSPMLKSLVMLGKTENQRCRITIVS